MSKKLKAAQSRSSSLKAWSNAAGKLVLELAKHISGTNVSVKGKGPALQFKNERKIEIDPESSAFDSLKEADKLLKFELDIDGASETIEIPYEEQPDGNNCSEISQELKEINKSLKDLSKNAANKQDPNAEKLINELDPRKEEVKNNWIPAKDLEKLVLEEEKKHKPYTDSIPIPKK